MGGAEGAGSLRRIGDFFGGGGLNIFFGAEMSTKVFIASPNSLEEKGKLPKKQGLPGRGKNKEIQKNKDRKEREASFCWVWQDGGVTTSHFRSLRKSQGGPSSLRFSYRCNRHALDRSGNPIGKNI